MPTKYASDYLIQCGIHRSIPILTCFKVIQKVGLCICFYDLLTASEGLIGHGTGLINVKVTFRLIIFRPFRGEVLEGTISESSPAGLRLHIEFFDDITVPGPSNLLDPSRYDPRENTWVWTSEDGSQFYFDKAERVRFRIEEEIWTDQAVDEEGGDLVVERTAQPADGDDEGARARKEEENRRKNRTPWRLVASMQQGGMGVLTWW
jgi:DNA-directed RNA polymerase III subunit RPC8